MKFLCVTEFGVRGDAFNAVLSESREAREGRKIDEAAYVATLGAADLMEVAVSRTPYSVLRPSSSLASAFRRANAGAWPETGRSEVDGVEFVAPGDIIRDSRPFWFVSYLRVPRSIRMVLDSGEPLGRRACKAVLGGRWQADWRQALGALGAGTARLAVSAVIGLDRSQVILLGRSERPDVFGAFISSILKLRRCSMVSQLSDAERVRIVRIGAGRPQDWLEGALFDECETRVGIAIDPNGDALLGGEVANAPIGRYGFVSRYRASDLAEFGKLHGDPVFGFFDSLTVEPEREFNAGEFVSRVSDLRSAGVATYTDLVLGFSPGERWPDTESERAFRAKEEARANRLSGILSTDLRSFNVGHKPPHGLLDAATELLRFITVEAFRDDDAFRPLVSWARDVAHCDGPAGLEFLHRGLARAVHARVQGVALRTSPPTTNFYRVGRDAFGTLMSAVAERAGVRAPLIIDGATRESTRETWQEQGPFVVVPSRSFRYPYSWHHGVHELVHQKVDEMEIGLSAARELEEAVCDALVFHLFRVPSDGRHYCVEEGSDLWRAGWLLFGLRLSWELRPRHQDRRRALVGALLAWRDGGSWVAFRDDVAEKLPDIPGFSDSGRGAPPWWEDFSTRYRRLVDGWLADPPGRAILAFRDYLAAIRDPLQLQGARLYPPLKCGGAEPGEVVADPQRRIRFGANMGLARERHERLTVELLLDLDEIGRLARLQLPD